MRKYFKVFIVAAIAAVAGYNVYQSQSVMNGMSEFALANVEAVAGCEATDGYPMDKYCIPGNGRCYYADFVADDCISNLV